jgi:hypothetical protein
MGARGQDRVMAGDAERGVCCGVEIYQLRVVIAGISPMIWRRLLVAADTTIAGLRTILQTVFGWSGEHLHRLVIHGAEYGTSYAGAEGFRDDARAVRLEDLGLRVGERFSYEYNYFAARSTGQHNHSDGTCPRMLYPLTSIWGLPQPDTPRPRLP